MTHIQFYLQHSQFCLDMFLVTGHRQWVAAFARWSMLACGQSILNVQAMEVLQ